MDIDFPAATCTSETYNDTEMSLKPLFDQIIYLSPKLVKSTFDYLYKNYCSYILFETIRIFPLIKFKFPLDLSEIFISNYTLLKPTQKMLEDEREELPVKRKSRKTSRPEKRMKIIEENSEFDSFSHFSQFNYCNHLSQLQYFSHQEYLSSYHTNDILIVY